MLVFAGASGVGIAATQIAKAMGAKVIATVRSDEKVELIRKFGADVIVNTKKTDIQNVFAEYPVNVVLDCVGGEQLGECFTKMARRGRWNAGRQTCDNRPRRAVSWRFLLKRQYASQPNAGIQGTDFVRGARKAVSVF